MAEADHKEPLSYQSFAQGPARERSVAEDELMIGLLDRSRDCVKILGLEGTLDFMNCGGEDALEDSEFSHVRGQTWWTLWPLHTQELVKQAFERARAGYDVEFAAECPTVQGNMRKWLVSLKPMTTDDGAVVGVLSTSRDVDEPQ